ncbi:conserved hypothetical protein [Desulfamplus magnetovallimortis]|uniref:Phosphatidylserine decarboxylase n=1 Tax=Desulfamplus magnetovallimortis TaxID=1246637 RepID=A0A1W1HIW1_9BACT|nr:phosphatidylserine decarboxylase [Desulfamplus magnetovallimortis]SLM32419.1 conserved hypothetical protein [Desulfamplus magnetovallimortis]
MYNNITHQYIDRKTGEVKTEHLFKDHVINFIYSRLRENAHFCFNLLISGRTSSLLGYLTFDFSFSRNRKKAESFIKALNINMSECLLPQESFLSARQVFERQIKYWRYRPNELDFHESLHDKNCVLSPCDSKMLVGSLKPGTPLFIKEKFFQYRELLEKEEWLECFKNGEFAIFRLTPDEYHYNHTPVSGKIADFYEINGRYHSCNPGAVVREVTPYSKNQRVVTVINTDVENGSHVGMVAMIEVTAMMIGRVEQCYSHQYYDNPSPMHKEMFIKLGQPKSLFRPGSSTVILMFESDRIVFSPDIIHNMHRVDAKSRFSGWFGGSLVETSVRVREEIGRTMSPSSHHQTLTHANSFHKYHNLDKPEPKSFSDSLAKITRKSEIRI